VIGFGHLLLTLLSLKGGVAKVPQCRVQHPT
jgi:hypothetical protein